MARFNASIPNASVDYFLVPDPWAGHQSTAAKRKGSVRILVTGDTLTLDQKEFPHRLEHMLNEEAGNDFVEILDGGASNYGPQNYLGFLRRFLYLKPHLFVVTVNTGNDFLDAIRIEAMNSRFSGPDRSNTRLMKAEQIVPGAVYEGLNQTFFFASFPDITLRSLDLFRQSLSAIKDLCRENGIELLVLLLPDKISVERQTDAVRLDKAGDLLRLSDESWKINRNLTLAAASLLSHENIRFVDLYETMTGASEKLFWDKEYRLNQQGHDRVAESILEEVGKVVNRIERPR